MIRILLIRHGSIDPLGRILYGRMPGISLNSEGLRQAERIAAVLTARYKIAEVLSSPLDRARQTAQPIARLSGLDLHIDERITEIDSGIWMGKSFDELSLLPEWKTYNRNRSTNCAPGGESMMHVQARAWQALELLTRRNSSSTESTLAVISHGDVIRCVLLLLLGMPIDHLNRIEIAPASVSEILLGPDAPTVCRMNECVY